MFETSCVLRSPELSLEWTGRQVHSRSTSLGDTLRQTKEL